VTGKIPSERLRDANADVAAAFKSMRQAIEKAGPLDYPMREYIMLAAFAAAGYEESFRIHVRRAAERGLPLSAVRQAVLIPFGATTAMLPVVNALQWADEAYASYKPPITTVTSRDGTSVGYSRTGDGAPLLLVHGSTSERSRWTPVLPRLQRNRSVLAMDRRGRGASGDAANYRMDAEFEDVAAVLDSLDAPADVVAHSYGAICALEATLRTRNIRRLVLYEPPIAAKAPSAEEARGFDAVVGEIEALIGRGERAAGLETFFAKVLRMPEAEIARARTLQSWPARLALAHTLPRELRSSRAYKFDAARFREHHIPTLIVLGGESPQRYQDTTALLHESLPGSKLAVIAGQGHGGIDGAPEVFAATVMDFLERN
jgi:pimeloyl-ACP methyl ester carboxylesterase/alkylhydroperoxidase/carboxymuconolactone decarboxylase family protein YurZ